MMSKRRRSLLVALMLMFHIVIGAAGLNTLCAIEAWRSIVADTEITPVYFEPLATSGTTAQQPVIIYLKNLASPRIGTESDETLISDFRREGFLVVVFDYAKHAHARMPWLNRDLGKMRDDVRAKKLLGDRAIDAAHVFIVPSGSRLKRDVVFFGDTGRTLAMDIIYPTQPTTPVGAVIEFSCDNQNRMGNTSLSICSDTALDGLAAEGFAVAMADHPVAPPYKGLDPMPECAWKIKAAVRTLRAEGRALGLNGKIASLGFSRGSGMTLMLATTEGLPEFEGHGSHADGNISSAIQGAVIMAGRFTYMDLLPGDKMVPRYTQVWGARDTEAGAAAWKRQGALDYLQKPLSMPLFLTINSTEGEDYQHQMRVLRNRLAELRNDEIFLMERDARGHKMPLAPELLTVMRDYLHRQVD